MAERSNSTLQEVLENAIELQRRRLLLEHANAAYSKLRADKTAWRTWRRELKELDSTLDDGI